MESEIIKYALQYGIFGVLFIWLFFDTRKDTKEREKQYQSTIKENQETIRENQNIISKLTSKFDIVDDIKKDLQDIKERIFDK
jgi:septal ring factor EnvC (AmiA/AmiB activator)